MTGGVDELLKLIFPKLAYSCQVPKHGPTRSVLHTNVMTEDEKRRQELYEDFARTRKSKAVPKPKRETRECPKTEEAKLGKL